MSKAEYAGLLKITDRAISMLIIWKRAFLRRDAERAAAQTELLPRVDALISEMAEYRFSLKRVLRGEVEPSTEEKLRFLFENAERAATPDQKKIYQDKIMELTRELLTDGKLEVADV